MINGNGISHLLSTYNVLGFVRSVRMHHLLIHTIQPGRHPHKPMSQGSEKLQHLPQSHNLELVVECRPAWLHSHMCCLMGEVTQGHSQRHRGSLGLPLSAQDSESTC